MFIFSHGLEAPDNIALFIYQVQHEYRVLRHPVGARDNQKAAELLKPDRTALLRNDRHPVGQKLILGSGRIQKLGRVSVPDKRCDETDALIHAKTVHLFGESVIPVKTVIFLKQHIPHLVGLSLFTGALIGTGGYEHDILPSVPVHILKGHGGHPAVGLPELTSYPVIGLQLVCLICHGPVRPGKKQHQPVELPVKSRYKEHLPLSLHGHGEYLAVHRLKSFPFNIPGLTDRVKALPVFTV